MLRNLKMHTVRKLFIGLAAVGLVVSLLFIYVLQDQAVCSLASYCIQSNADKVEFKPLIEHNYTFSIIDENGDTVKDFEVVHTKPMHTIVVRKDLEGYQHLHSKFDETKGKFSLDSLVFPTNGQYRIFADFKPQNKPGVTLYEDVVVGVDDFVSKPLSIDIAPKVAAGYTVNLSSRPGDLFAGETSTIIFELRDEEGKLVIDLDEYLGALGHVVILKETTLDFIHAHPLPNLSNQNGVVVFEVVFPTPGMYKMFAEFKRMGTVSTIEFIVPVLHGSKGLEEHTGH